MKFGMRDTSLEITSLETGLIIFFRVAMGWTFLYAGVSQIANPTFSMAGFVLHAKTAHGVLVWLGDPAIAPSLSFLIEWLHTIIGLSLVAGCFVRFSAPIGIFLLGAYYFGHMDWPYIENRSNFIMDYHLVYIGVLVYLMDKQAGRVWGLDGMFAKSREAGLDDAVARFGTRRS
jgi:thiosulfate dehydrogenase (quinone) large subunit